MPKRSQRVGTETSATRALILEAANRLIHDEGYAAISTRRVAISAGVKPSLVHYYFPTTDDLLLAMSRFGAEESDRMIEQAMQSLDPVRSLWSYLTDPRRIAMGLEFMALANHRPALRAHMAAHVQAVRERETVLFTKLLGDRLSGPYGCEAEGLSLILAGIGRALVLEGGLGVTAGHSEAQQFVERWLDRLFPIEQVQLDQM